VLSTSHISPWIAAFSKNVDPRSRTLEIGFFRLGMANDRQRDRRLRLRRKHVISHD
jgi:hypothetical protein